MYIPRLDLELVEGGRVTIGAPPMGRWQVLFLYNTSCGFCRASAPAWEDVARRAHELGVEVYGLSVDSLEATRRFVADHQLTFPSALLNDGRSRALFRADAVPQTVVIDTEGRVLYARPQTLTQRGGDSVLAVVSELKGAGSRR
jgi:cytochrome c biogenesis protein CcmG, thiol:disulfide interchange protein DsbE